MLLPLQVSWFLALRKPRGLDIVYELILNVLPFLDRSTVLFAILD